MTKRKYTKEKLDLIKAYLGLGKTYREIASQLNLTYDQLKHCITRYNLKEESETGFVLPKEASKLKKEHMIKLAQTLGKEIYNAYKVVKLREPKTLKSKAKREEHSVLDISDVHIGMLNTVFDSKTGKKEVTYNMEIFEKELATLQESVFQIHEILRNSYKLKKLTIFMLGDIITNDRIFENQVFEIEKIAGLQIWDAIAYFSKFFNNLLKIYETIDVVCVVGNHGRSQAKSYDEPVENSFEYFIYKTLQKQFEHSKRINIIVPETRRYIHKIYGWRHLIEHGDSMRGFSDSYIERQVKELALNVGGFDMLHVGHLHKLKEREISDTVIVKHNGCWISKDNYGFAKFKQYSVPKQWFFGCNEKRVETWNFKIDLRS